MAKLCEACRAHAPDDSLADCPTCGGPLKFTLLPPPGQDAEPLPGVPRGRTGRYGNNPEAEGCAGDPPGPLGAVFGIWAKPAAVGLPLLLAVAVFCRWLAASDDIEERAAKIRPGMPMVEAVRIMGSDPTPPRRPARWPDVDMTPPTEGDGEVVWEGGSKAITVRFRDGVVTEVQHGEAQGGMRKRVRTVVR